MTMTQAATSSVHSPVVATMPAIAAAPVAPRPFVKWAGGKTQLLAQLEPLLPADLDRLHYREPFLGGGALFLHLAAQGRIRYATLSDINPDLILTWRMVQDSPAELARELRELLDAYPPTQADAYYAVRARYNRDRAELRAYQHAAMFIYLNKLAFNGLHRVNRKGEFNVAFGQYKNPSVYDFDNLRAVSRALRFAKVGCVGFNVATMHEGRDSDFYYLDPPYVPVTDTANFTGYSADGFGEKEQRWLAGVYGRLTQQGARCMLSNSAAPFVLELYGELAGKLPQVQIHRVSARRAINRDGAKRGAIEEVVVTNYPVASAGAGGAA